MSEGFFPILRKRSDGSYSVRNKENLLLGEIWYHDEWGCHVFSAINGHSCIFRPAFLASLGNHLNRLDAKKRRR